MTFATSSSTVSGSSEVVPSGTAAPAPDDRVVDVTGLIVTPA